MPAQGVEMISSMATRELLCELAAQFTAVNGGAVRTQSAGGVDVAKRVAGGENFDVVVLAANVIDQLISAAHLLPGSRVDLVRSGIAVAIRAGAPPLAVLTEHDVRLAVLRAASMAYSSGPSGVYLTQLFQRWGIFEQIRRRIVQAPPGVPVGTLVAQGEVELGFQQLSELMHLPGITVLGSLPAPIQSITVFAAGLTVAARLNPTAQALVRFMASDATSSAKYRHGMEPA